MAFTELELKRIDRSVGELCRLRSLPQFADELRFVYEVEGHVVSVYEERLPWRGDGDWTRSGIARFRFVRSKGVWRLYWMRSDLRWYLYETDEMPSDLDALVAIVEADEFGAFFG